MLAMCLPTKHLSSIGCKLKTLSYSNIKKPLINVVSHGILPIKY